MSAHSANKKIKIECENENENASSSNPRRGPTISPTGPNAYQEIPALEILLLLLNLHKSEYIHVDSYDFDFLLVDLAHYYYFFLFMKILVQN